MRRAAALWQGGSRRSAAGRSAAPSRRSSSQDEWGRGVRSPGGARMVRGGPGAPGPGKPPPDFRDPAPHGALHRLTRRRWEWLRDPKESPRSRRPPGAPPWTAPATSPTSGSTRTSVGSGHESPWAPDERGRARRAVRGQEAVRGHEQLDAGGEGPLAQAGPSSSTPVAGAVRTVPGWSTEWTRCRLCRWPEHSPTSRGGLIRPGSAHRTGKGATAGR